ncbi:hypothetical protein BTVI_74901 [Pitangus sulphuratus]|nr:hypothetical protein BTVI_74901 [Pitangus sulphuratus]
MLPSPAKKQRYLDISANPSLICAHIQCQDFFPQGKVSLTLVPSDLQGRKRHLLKGFLCAGQVLLGIQKRNKKEKESAFGFLSTSEDSQNCRDVEQGEGWQHQPEAPGPSSVGCRDHGPRGHSQRDLQPKFPKDGHGQAASSGCCKQIMGFYSMQPAGDVKHLYNCLQRGTCPTPNMGCGVRASDMHCSTYGDPEPYQWHSYQFYI